MVNIQPQLPNASSLSGYCFSSSAADVISVCATCSKLQKLDSLEVCGGRVTDLGVGIISLIPSLTSLSLAHNVGITDTALGHLARLTQLCSLNLTHSRITSNGVTALYGLTVCHICSTWTGNVDPHHNVKGADEWSRVHLVK